MFLFVHVLYIIFVWMAWMNNKWGYKLMFFYIESRSCGWRKLISTYELLLFVALFPVCLIILNTYRFFNQLYSYCVVLNLKKECSLHYGVMNILYLQWFDLYYSETKYLILEHCQTFFLLVFFSFLSGKSVVLL